MKIRQRTKNFAVILAKVFSFTNLNNIFDYLTNQSTVPVSPVYYEAWSKWNINCHIIGYVDKLNIISENCFST